MLCFVASRRERSIILAAASMASVTGWQKCVVHGLFDSLVCLAVIVVLIDMLVCPWMNIKSGYVAQ